MKTKLSIFLMLFLSIAIFGQQNFWTKVENKTIKDGNLKARWSKPNTFSLYNLNDQKLVEALKNAPQRFSNDYSLVLQFPDTKGNFRDYIVQEASVMEPELQAKFPEFKSYVGWQKDNSANSIRFSITPIDGISIMYFDNWDVSYLDSYTKDNSTYILYERNAINSDRSFQCLLKDHNDVLENNDVMNIPVVSDGLMRKYRLAIAATGEYTAFQGGTVPDAMSAIVTTITRVDGIYEKSISTTMVLVANNNLLVYTNAATDPYTNGDAEAMIEQNQTNVTSVIGSANFDIGHVFGTNSGGLAGLGVICKNGSKAYGITGSGAPVGDPFDVDYVAHEVGHQFGADHTFRGNVGACEDNANNSTAFEPGSGSTIMAYAGICGSQNIQAHSDPYFHATSINEMFNYIKNGGNSCPVKTSNGNNVPTANAGADYTIPKGTAFVLTGVGTDPDNDTLTFCWEQYDNQNSTQPPVNTSVNGPNYRSIIPSTNTKRYFPSMSNVLANNLFPKWEVTPNVARTLNFSLTVNDNKATGNQTANDKMIVTVTNNGPFKVTSHTTNTSYNASVPTTITWDVAGTNTVPINTQNVQILLSKNAGSTFDTVLAESVPNNGSAIVTLPNENISSARIMVKAVDNIYFAVNSSNFSVSKSLAIADATAKIMTVYPNPSHDEVNVMLKNATQSGKYIIYDAAGRLIKSGELKNTTKIKVKDLANGNYILTVILDSGEKFSEKLMIQK